MEVIMELLTVSESLVEGGSFPIPFATRGTTAASHSRHIMDIAEEQSTGPCGRGAGDLVWIGQLRDTRGLMIQFANEEEDWGSGDDGSNPRRLSDYTLVRNWVKDVQRSSRPAFLSDVPLYPDSDAKNILFRCDGEVGGTSETPIRSVRSISRFGNFDWDSPTNEWGGILTSLEVRAMKGMISKGLILSPEDALDYAMDGAGAAELTRLWNAADAPPHVLDDEYGGSATATSEELLLWQLKENNYHKDENTVHGNSQIVFESKSFYVIVRAETPFWAYDSADYDQVGDIVEFNAYLGLKKKTLLGDDNTNKAIAHATSNTFRAFLDFENAVTANESEDYRENYNLITTLFNAFQTEQQLREGYSELLLNEAPTPGLTLGANFDPAAKSQSANQTSLAPVEDPAALRTGDLSSDPPGDTPTSGPDNSYFQEFVKSIFPSIKMKTRLVYMTPSEELTHFIGYDKDNPAGEYGSGGPISRFMLTDPANVKRYKSFFIYDGGGSAFAHIATGKIATIDLTSALFDRNEFQTFINEGGGSNSFPWFLENYFEENKPKLAQGLADATRDLFGGEKPMVDIDRILQYLYITGELKTYYSHFIGPDKDIFVDTKQTLILALQAAFGEESSQCEPTALGNTLLNGALSAATPLANLGTSFANKVIKETPYYILKGICEIAEPHVIISKKIKEVSAFVFDQMEKGLDMAQMGATTASALSALGADLRDPCEDEIDEIPDPPIPMVDIPSMNQIIRLMNTGINEKYPAVLPPEFKPVVSRQGIDLEGTLPYTFIVPPLTPFGILYLILKLSEYGVSPLDAEQCSEDDWRLVRPE